MGKLTKINHVSCATLVGILSVSPMASMSAIGGSVMGNGGSTSIQQIVQIAEAGVSNVELGVQTGIQGVQADIAGIQATIAGNQYVQQVMHYANAVENTVVRYKQFATQIQNLIKTGENVVTAPQKWANDVNQNFSQRGFGFFRDAAQAKIASSYGVPIGTGPDAFSGPKPALAAVLKIQEEVSHDALEQNAMMEAQWVGEDRVTMDALVNGSNKAEGALMIAGEANKIAIENVRQIQLQRWQQMQLSKALITGNLTAVHEKKVAANATHRMFGKPTDKPLTLQELYTLSGGIPEPIVYH